MLCSNKESLILKLLAMLKQSKTSLCLNEVQAFLKDFSLVIVKKSTGNLWIWSRVPAINF